MKQLAIVCLLGFMLTATLAYSGSWSEDTTFKGRLTSRNQKILNLAVFIVQQQN
jgi:hypothetical protein